MTSGRQRTRSRVILSVGEMRQEDLGILEAWPPPYVIGGTFLLLTQDANSKNFPFSIIDADVRSQTFVELL